MEPARRIWHKVETDRFGAKNPRSWALRFHTQTAGVSLTAQQPLNNDCARGITGWLECSAEKSLTPTLYDEALALPSSEAAPDRSEEASSATNRV